MSPRRATSKSIAEFLGQASDAGEVPAEESREVPIEKGLNTAYNLKVILKLMWEVVGLVRGQSQHQALAPPSPPSSPPSEAPKKKTVIEFKRSCLK